MAVNGVSTVAVAMMGGGLLFLWSGYHGAHVTGSLRDLLAGKQPAATGDESVGLPGLSNTGSATSSAPAAPTSASGNVANGQLQAAAYGWNSGAEWNALYDLWRRESDWSNTAQNPDSTAYGIAQFLDTTWPPYGPKTSDATLQIRYGLQYVKDRYGSPSRAWAHEQSAGWY